MQPAKAKDIREAIDKVAADPTRAEQQSAPAQRRTERVPHSGRRQS
jgi:hypothetical protein